MKNLDIFIYMEKVVTYRRPTLNTVAVTFKNEKNTHSYSNSSGTLSVTELLAEILDIVVSDLSSGDYEEFTIILDSKEDIKLQKMFDGASQGGIDKLRIGLTKSNQPNVDSRISITESVLKLGSVDGVIGKKKITFGADLEPEIIGGMLQCESYAARAHTLELENHLVDGPLILIETPSGTGKVSPLPNLLMDKLLFDIGLSTNVLDGGSAYFTGNGAIESNKPKKMTVAAKKAASGYMYYTGSNDKLRVLGRPSSEDRYNVLLLKDRSKYLDDLLEHQVNINKGIYKTKQFVVYSLANVTNNKLNKELTKGNFSILKSTDNGDLYTLTLPRRDLSYVMNPPRLAFKLRRTLENNLNMLISFITNTYNKETYTYTDITEYVFDNANNDLVAGVDKLTKKLTLKGIKIPNGQSVNIKPLLKFDLPEYLKLRKLRLDNPKLHIATWMVDQHTVAYSFVISTDEGHLYYSSEYGSRHLLPTVRKSKRKVK